MTFNTFKERLNTIRRLDIQLDDAVEKVNNNYPFMVATSVTRSELLSDLIWEHLFTLFAAVREDRLARLGEFVDFYFYHQNYGGLIQVNGEDFYLDDDEQLFNYLEKYGY